MCYGINAINFSSRTSIHAVIKSRARANCWILLPLSTRILFCCMLVKVTGFKLLNEQERFIIGVDAVHRHVLCTFQCLLL